MKKAKGLSVRPVHMLTFVFVFICWFHGILCDEAELLCPTHCSCRDKPWEELLGKYNQKHSVLRGEDYRSENNSNVPPNYSHLFGLVSHTFVKDVVEINCIIQDKKKHILSEFLNNIHETRYTALEVKCKNKEEILWDVPAWVSTFNIFVNEHCSMRSENENNSILLSQNLWIIENYGNNALHTNYVLNYAMNLIALIMAESSSEVYPRLKLHLPHIQTVSYHSNNLRQFDCEKLTIMVHLDTLNLGGNELSHFPECIVDPDRLTVTYLSLAHNVISNISILFTNTSKAEMKFDDTVRNLPLNSVSKIEQKTTPKEPKFEILDLSHNEIENLEIFIDISSLTTLDLSYNLIRKIQRRSFENFPNLSWLSLSHNRIHSMHEQVFSSNMLLHQLDLSNNDIDTVKSSMLPSDITTLDIDVRYNKLKYPLLFKCMEKSKHKGLASVKLRMSGNPFICDCKAIDFEKCLSKLKILGNLDDIRDLNKFQCHLPRETRGVRLVHALLQNKCVFDDGCPFGCKCHLLKEKTLVVNCSSRHFMELPDNIPDVDSDIAVVMLLSHNPIQLLGYRPYLHRISELYIHNCLLSAVTSDALNALKDVRVLALHKNLLKRLPQSTQNVSMKHLQNLTLHGNRWACDCQHLWLSKWLKARGPVLWTPSKVQCAYTRQPVTELSNADVQCDTDYVDVALVVVMVMSTLLSTLYVFYYYRREINQLLYIKLGLRLFEPFKYNDVYSVYDAFVFYSQNNYKWVVDTLLDRLEEGQVRYKLCLHFRDFPKDEVAVDNIPLAINLSRCSLLLLSRDFLENEWLIPSLRTAFQRYLFGTDSLIVVVTDDIQLDELTPDLRAYMTSHEVLYINDENFWQKLEYFLPPPRFYNEDVPSDATDTARDGDLLQQDKTSGATCLGLSDMLDGTAEKDAAPRDTTGADKLCQGDYS